MGPCRRRTTEGSDRKNCLVSQRVHLRMASLVRAAPSWQERRGAMTATQQLYSTSEAIRVLLGPHSVAELRAPSAQGHTLSGYFDDHSLLAKKAAELSGTVPGVYVTLNPVRADLLARAMNRVIRFAK